MHIPTPFPELQTPRLQLREVQDTDRSMFYALLTNPVVIAHFLAMHLQDEADAQKVINMFRRVYAEGTALRWVICHEGKAIGFIGYHTYIKGHKGTIVYALLPEYWGKGLAAEAITAVIQHGFQQMGLQRIDAEVLPGNTASEKVLLKNGFEYEGLLKKWLQWGGAFYDVNMYGRVK